MLQEETFDEKMVRFELNARIHMRKIYDTILTEEQRAEEKAILATKGLTVDQVMPLDDKGDTSTYPWYPN